ncbi:MAG TPA: protein kinase, partial [Gemmataceae bacterium]|nr:protein kinase [Gemmataceae bacterium]
AAEHSDVPDREERLGAVLVACLEAIDRGQFPGREEWLTRYPEFAAELNRFLDDQERVERCAAPLRAVAVAAAGSRPAGSLRSLGDYELLEEIGQGGMATVYRARQRSLGRTVAVKVVRAADGANRRDAERFRREAELAAHLDHPHIVPVYEVGEQDGYVYFSMKLIEGSSLADCLDRFTADPRAAAQLLTLVARAVHHAHQRGVLHRDLKPANILLDGAGHPHVTDFGLARRVEGDSSLTQSGALVGTPSYMAPEQTSGRQGEVTTAADVYGLGAVLYALLTGRPPFRADTAVDTLLLVREREPEPPRRINARVDRNLETVCLKCLAKEPGRRYGSAAELADDLDRWLAGKPVRARRAGPWERALKWVRRRPALAGLLAVLALSMVALVVGLLWHNGQLQEAAKREQWQAEKAARQRDEARRAVNDMYTEVAEKWLAGEPGMTAVQREFLEKALRYYEALAWEEGEGPELLLERAKANGRMGVILTKLERRAEAEAAHIRAITILEGTDFPGKVAELADEYSHLGTFFLRTTRYAEAESAFHRALALWGSLPADEAARPDVRFSRAIALSDLGATLTLGGRHADSKGYLQQGLLLVRGLVAEFPRDSRYHHLLGGMLNNYAMVTEEEAGPARARRYLDEAISNQEEAVRLAPHDANNRLFLRNHYAALATGPLLALKQFPAAIDTARKSLTVSERLATDFPEVPHYRRCLADAYGDLGQVLNSAGQISGAEDATRRAVSVQERVLAADPDSPPDRLLLGQLYDQLGELRQASGQGREAVTLYRKALEFYPKSAANNNLAWLLALGAEPGFDDPAELVRLARTATESNPREGARWVTRGLAHYRAGDWAAAKAALAKASDLSPVDDGLRGLVLAMTECRFGDRIAARTAYDQAIKRLAQDRPKPSDHEARRLQDEAAQLLGVTGPAMKPGGRKESK